MFLEGEVNWVLVLGVIAGVMTLLAAFSSWFAFAHRERHVSASGELDLVQKVAESADKRLFETLNAIPVALVETDLQGKFVFANRAAHQLLGRRDAELLGLRFHSATWGITFPDGRVVPPDMLPSARALRGQTVRGFQHILANPATRRKMLVSVTAMPIENEYGQIVGSTAAIVETEGLTTPEPIVVEAPAAPVDDLTRRVFAAASSALVIVSAHGRVLDANPAALTALGRSQAFEGEDFADLFVGAEHRTEARQTLRAALTAPAGEADPIVAPPAIAHPAGAPPAVAPPAFASGAAGQDASMTWRILPLANAEGVVDTLLLAGDASPEPEVEQPDELREPAEISETAEPVEAVDKPIDAEAHTRPSDAPAIDHEAFEALVSERDAALARAEDALRQAEAARADAETAVAEAERIERRAAAEQDSVRRMESVGRVTGGVAQDFTALLGVMTSALDMMLKQADDPNRVRRLGQAALAAGQRGEALTRRLTALSEGEDVHRQSLDAGVLLRAMETRLRALAGSGVDLLIEAPSAPALVRLDPVAFEATVRALVANAVEAVDGQGSVAVRLETTTDGARLSVRDTGPGMASDIRARASEPFFTTKAGATGLGLAQVQSFARQSGGVLSIESAPGQGSEVAVILPAEAA